MQNFLESFNLSLRSKVELIFTSLQKSLKIVAQYQNDAPFQNIKKNFDVLIYQSCQMFKERRNLGIEKTRLKPN